MKKLLLIVMAVALMVAVADAKKRPKPPPPDPDPVDVGTIYFTEGAVHDRMYRVQADGSGYAALDPAISGGAEPSLLRHVDSSGVAVRWFLQAEIADGAYQLFAVSESGDRHRLVNDPTLQVGGSGASYAYPRWASDDGLVSFCAVRYDRPVDMAANGDPQPSAKPLPEESGQYLLEIEPQAMAPLSAPILLPLPHHDSEPQPVYLRDQDGNFVLDENGEKILTGYEGGDAAGNLVSDLSPGGTSIVYQSYAAYAGTWRADATNWAVATRFPALAEQEYLYVPRWSPDGSMVIGKANGDIVVVPVEGAERQALVLDPEDGRNLVVGVNNPFWSPSGTHVVYRRGARRTFSGAKLRLPVVTHEIHIVDVETGLSTFFREGFPRGWRGP